MRKRCFIIAAIALAIGGFFHWHSYPDETLISMGESLNRAREKNNERRTQKDHFLYGTAFDEYVDPYERASTDVAISYVSFGLTGVMILVGFIVGPPKEEVVSNKDQNESSS
tara:strand:- start:133 stop:468 length:336 start_codon:yes stop_codon:yes gene_type:complete